MLKAYPELIFIVPVIVLFIIATAIEIKIYRSAKKKDLENQERIKKIIKELREGIKNEE